MYQQSWQAGIGRCNRYRQVWAGIAGMDRCGYAQQVWAGKATVSRCSRRSRCKHACPASDPLPLSYSMWYPSALPDSHWWDQGKLLTIP